MQRVWLTGFLPLLIDFGARTVHIQVDQYLARPWLWHIEHLDLGGDSARVIVDASFVLLGDFCLRTHFDG